VTPLSVEERTLQDLTLEELTFELGRSYTAWKAFEESKNEEKDEFFARATALAAEGELAEQLVEVWAKSEASAVERLEKYHPRYAVDEIRLAEANDVDGGLFEAIMVERPEFKPFSYVNAQDRRVYSRQVQDGAILLDEERLKVEDPSLYQKVTFELPWGQTIVRPLDKLDADDLAALQPYVYRGKPVAKFPKPRAATEEELAALEDEGDD